MPFAPDRMFDLVADVGAYPEFLPWCLATRIVGREGEAVMLVEMEIGFKVIRERYLSRVELRPPAEIAVTAAGSGPFRDLDTLWRFTPGRDGGTEVDFSIGFAFRSRLLQAVAGAVFGEASRLMVGAFQRRAEALYGKEAIR